jgi:membrane associated rhomboid family serine protease
MPDEPTTNIRETLLRQILATEPGAWYLKDHSDTAGIDPETLYGPLNDLRVASLVQLTEWVQGKGQGYIITPLGKEVLNDPVFLNELRDGRITQAAPAPEKASDRPIATRFDLGEAARRAFFYGAPVRVVPILIIANLVMFTVSFAVAYRTGVPAGRFLGGGDVLALHKVGAVGADDLAKGEWWRLITSCFLHFGLLHLTLNMFSLGLMSRVEGLWGSGRFLVLYLTCGLCGSCTGVFYNPGDETKIVYLAGASGALWGVMISEAVWLLLHRSHLPPGDVRRWLQQLFFTLLLNVGVSMLPGVSASAHFGGGIAGAFASILLQMHRFGSPGKRALAGFLLAMLPTIYLLGLATAFEYDSRLQPFMVKVYREQIDARLGKLPVAMDDLEPKAEKLFLQESAKRDPAELSRVRDGLSGLTKQAKEAREWVERSAPVGSAKPMRERGLEMIDALIPYAESLDKQAGGVVVAEINDQRKKWQDARVAWTQVVGK